MSSQRFISSALLCVLLFSLAPPDGIAAPSNQTAQPHAAPTPPIQLDNRRELFLDRFLIERMKNVGLVLHTPRDEGCVLKFEKPWEGAFCGYCTVIRDDQEIHLYYRGVATSGKDGNKNERTCYAVSTDGITWTKPELGLFDYKGSKKTNIILHDFPQTHNFSPFLDTRPGVPPTQRFKGLGGKVGTGLVAYVSANGTHWQRLQKAPVFKKGEFDSQNVAFWSQAEQRYVLYFRSWTKGPFKGFRTVSRTTSTDFLHWEAPQKMSFGKTPPEHLYTNQTHPYFRAPHIYVATAARFMPGRKVVSDQEAKTLGVDPKYYRDCSDAVLMTSRGGTTYDRTFMSSFIRPGIGIQNWVSRTNYPALNVIQTGPTEMSLYVNQDYAQPSAHLRRYSLRLDGFASVRAPYAGGELVTKPFTFKGKHLFLNFATSAAGGIRVEIQDESGKPIPGYAQATATELIGNEIERVVSWKNGSNVSALAGRTIRLRFILKDADLYALQFR